MIFGNAEFMEYPWETIVKIYRKQKGQATEELIESWGKDFVEFVKAFGDIDDKHKIKNVSGICYSSLSSIQGKALNEAAEENVAIGSSEYIDILGYLFDQRINHLKKQKDWADKVEAAALAKRFRKQINDAVETCFGELSNKSITDKAKLCLKLSLLKESFSPQSSGFVIAGFGEKEYFPTLFEYSVDGYVGDRIKISVQQTSDLSREMHSCIRAFAQGDMVARFMNGVDQQLHTTLIASFMESLTENCLAVLDKYGDAANKTDVVKSEIETAVVASMKSIVSESRSYINSRFVQPVIRMVAVLPKDELAHLAESLVALTSLKRRVSSDAETVGGPVDVALISKGDGFVWVKRKFYFPPNLNPRFSTNYLFDVGAGEQHAE